MRIKIQNELPLLGQAILIVALLFAAGAPAMTKAFEVNVRVRYVEVQPGPTEPQQFDWYPKDLEGRPLSTLTDTQLQAVLKALDQHNGADLLSDNQVTTLSGRPMQLRPARCGAPIAPNLGFVGKVSSNGLTIQIPVHQETTFSTSQFLPQLHSRVVRASMKPKDGQTFVLGGLAPNLLIFVTPTVIGPGRNPIHSMNYYDGPRQK